MARDLEIQRKTIYRLIWYNSLPKLYTLIKVTHYFGKPLDQWLEVRHD
jgi:DNA-binding phage protein